jgi:hypothetical protein
MPIADDPFGNIIFLGVAGGESGRVYFGDHELEDPDTGHLALSIIAESFTGFMEGCYEAAEG